MKRPDPAAIKTQVKNLAVFFEVSPAAVRRWIKTHGLNKLPHPAEVAHDLINGLTWHNRATMPPAAMQEGKRPFLVGYREGLKRPIKKS